MLKTYMTAGLIGSTMLASAAFAQTSTTPSTTTPSAAPIAASDSSYTGNWRASKVVGLNVYNDKNESLGSINDLLTDQKGNIKAVVVGVGGFLGVGEHLVAVPFDKIKFSNTPVMTTSAAAGTGGTGMTGGASTTPAAGTTTGSASAVSSAKPNPWYPDHAVLNANKDELKAMTEFKYAN